MDIAKSIGALLFKNNAVVVPGFGAFTTDHKSANIDFVQANISPPAKSISFNENLKLNDGVLVDYLQKQYDISVEDAQKAIDDFVNSMKATLAKKEIVELTKVGRLYLDYENKLKFLPEGTNFNTDSFGLPTVSSKPIVRKTTAPKAASTVAATSQTIKGKNKTASPSTKTSTYSQKDLKENWLSKSLMWLLLVALIVIFFSLYMIFRTPTPAQPADTAAEENLIDEDRLNKSPADDEKFLDDPEDLEDFNMDEEKGDTINEPEEEIDTEGETFHPDEKEVFIVIHSLTKRKGAESFIKKLTKDGYNAASVRDGRFYRVGVEFLYKEERELEELKAQLQEEYGSKLAIWKGGKGRAN